MFGDQLLQAVSLALLSCLEEDQLLARLGGDEFIVLATQTSQGSLEAVASRILTRLRQPFRIGLIEVYTGCTIGISLAPSMDRIAIALFVMPIPRCTTRKKAVAANSAFFHQK
ncbi:RNase II stability modulator [Salmonella bongori]|nr:RNase II stability modulator [Salmonella bongori]